jgi:hypothetical protein
MPHEGKFIAQIAGCGKFGLAGFRLAAGQGAVYSSGYALYL